MFNLKSEFKKMPIVAILRNTPIESLDMVCQILSEEGIRLVEMTMNSDDLEESYNKLLQLQEKYPNLSIGAGTVTTEEVAKKAYELGAKFFVTPNTNTRVMKFANEHKIPVLCGALTPSEIVNAHELGACYVKLFPLGTLGVSYVREFYSALNNIPFVPTGAISVEDISAYKELNAHGFGLGSKLISNELLLNKDFNEIRSNVKRYVEKVSEVYEL